jgi:5-oxoprolinase (ATP-hydrolysing)
LQGPEIQITSACLLDGGQIGENWVRRKDGGMERLQGCDATTLEAGEAIIIQTPTAGGYGRREDTP